MSDDTFKVSVLISRNFPLFFFLKDRIDKGELNVEHCPTDMMVADFFSKPLQGSKFIEFRNIIMGIC